METEKNYEADLDEALAPKKENDPNEIFKRQLDFIKPDRLAAKEIVIIGCGSTGSSVALLLLKTGFTTFSLCDFDEVSIHNLSNQLHSRDFVGKSKTDSLEALLKFQSPTKELIVHKYDNIEKIDYRNDQIVMVCVDSMEARRAIWKWGRKLIENSIGIFFVDIRVGGFKYNIYAIDNNRPHWGEYEATLKGDPTPLPCHAKSYMISSVLASSIGCQMVFDYMRLIDSEKQNELLDWMVFGSINNGDIMLMSNSTATQSVGGPKVVSVA
jgi:molybdopterin/thiamine biosynthesis adenylyltransferase